MGYIAGDSPYNQAAKEEEREYRRQTHGPKSRQRGRYQPSGGGGYDAILRAQEEYDKKQRELEKASRLASIEAAINQSRAGAQAQIGELEPQIGDVESSRQFRRGETTRQSALQRAVMQRQFGGRGLAFSGIREGGEARHSANLLTQLGGIDIGAQQQADAIRRAIERINKESAAQIAALEAERGAL